MMLNRPSRFIDDIPDHILEKQFVGRGHDPDALPGKCRRKVVDSERGERLAGCRVIDDRGKEQLGLF